MSHEQTKLSSTAALSSGMLIGVIGLILCAAFLVVGPNGKLSSLRESERSSQAESRLQDQVATSRESETSRGPSLYTPHIDGSREQEKRSSERAPKRNSASTAKTSPKTSAKSPQQTEAPSTFKQSSKTSTLKARLIHEARRFARQSEEPWRNLITVALEEKRNGNRTSALKLLEAADRLASDPDSPQEQALAKREVVKAMLSLRLDEEALLITSSLAPGKHRDDSLSDLSTWLAKDGQTQLSKSIAQSIEDKKSRNKALTYVTESEVNTLGVNFAITTASEISDGRYRDDALKKAAVRAASLNDYIGAELAANTIHDYRRKDSTLSAIASLRAKSGSIEPSMELLNHIVDSRVADETMRQLAVYLAKEHRFSASSMVIRHINNQKEIDFARQQLATSKANAGRLPEALSELNSIQNTNYKERTLSTVALAVSKEQGIFHARNIADQILTEKLRDQTYRQMADYAAINGNLTSAFNLTQDIQASAEKTTALSYIAKRRLKAGDSLNANRYLVDAENEFLNIESSTFRDRALSTLSTIYAEMGEPEIALERAYTIRSNRQRDRAYKTLSKILASQKRISIAISSADAIIEDEERQEAMDNVALTYGKVVNPYAAIRMTQSFHSYRQKMLFLLAVSKRV